MLNIHYARKIIQNQIEHYGTLPEESLKKLINICPQLENEVDWKVITNYTQIDNMINSNPNATKEMNAIFQLVIQIGRALLMTVPVEEQETLKRWFLSNCNEIQSIESNPDMKEMFKNIIGFKIETVDTLPTEADVLIKGKTILVRTDKPAELLQNEYINIITLILADYFGFISTPKLNSKLILGLETIQVTQGTLLNLKEINPSLYIYLMKSCKAFNITLADLLKEHGYYLPKLEITDEPFKYYPINKTKVAIARPVWRDLLIIDKVNYTKILDKQALERIYVYDLKSGKAPVVVNDDNTNVPLHAILTGSVDVGFANGNCNDVSLQNIVIH